MTTMYKYAFLTAVIVAIFALVIWYAPVRQTALGSVIQGNEYTSTTTDSGSVGHWLARSVTGGSTCALGSIVVASSSVTTFQIWDATTTVTDLASTSLVTLKASVPEGTYTFDVGCSRGLVVDVPTNFDGNYVVTYR